MFIRIGESDRWFDRLDSPSTSAAGYGLYASWDADSFWFLFDSATTAIGAGTTLWLDNDLDRSTGYQIWGFAGGIENYVDFGADGVARLYDSGGGLVQTVQTVANVDSTQVWFQLDRSVLAGAPERVRVFADVNNAVFLPNDYSNIDLFVGNARGETSVLFGGYTLDGSLSDWAAGTRLDTLTTGAPGYSFYGDVTEAGAVFAIGAPLAIGGGTTIWLDTDLNASTGYQIWGFAGGAEYNIEIAADGTAALYTGGAGQVFVAMLDAIWNVDRTLLEVAVPVALAGIGAQVRVLADVNNAVFLPNDYSNINLIAGTVPLPPVDAPDLRVGIVYSETTAANWFDLTAYGQLVMSAQHQAMQAGIPFDLLGEADLMDPVALAAYDVLVFPGMSHVKSGDLAAITAALRTATEGYGVSLVAAGNFLTNDETGAAIAGNSYQRMQDLLGVTIEGAGTTSGLRIVADAGSNPILDGYTPGETVGDYGVNSFLRFTDTTGTGEVLFSQVASGPGGVETTYDAVIATTAGGRAVHFASDAIIGNSNILQSAIRWAVADEAPAATLRMTRGESLFYSRNDMDVSQQYDSVALASPGVYDLMLPIVESWYSQYGFVGSYYINIGAAPPDERTDWSVSAPYYQRLLALDSEIGTHSYTHPDDTNLLQPDSPELLALLALIDPGNPNAPDPSTLSAADRALLMNSFRFQFETSAREIEQQLGITVTGAAVPGAPERLATSVEIIRFFDYMTGGYSGEGAGYPGAFGFLTPDLQDAVYLAPNMSFDFSLIGFQKLSVAQAIEVWAQEYAAITTHGAAPIIAFPWHDYGPTEWSFDGEQSPYAREMFDAVLARAAADGTEFVTGQDLAGRIRTMTDAELTVTRAGDVVTADVVSTDAGKFALDLGDGQISSVAGWYAWNASDVFLPRNGGTFAVTLGGAVADVTRVSGLPMRADLISVSGDGTNLQVQFEGRGLLDLTLQTQGARIVHITGATGATLQGTSGVALNFAANAQHELGVAYLTGSVVGGTAQDILLGTSANDVLNGAGGNDTLFGGAGDDRLSGGLGNDLIDGGAGTDTIILGAQITVDLRITGAQNTGEGLDTIVGIENVEAGSGNNRLTGNALSNRLAGNGGNDTLEGESGDDTLIGGSGNDRISGGSGIDTAIFNGQVTVDLRSTKAQNTGEGNDTLISIENLVSGTGNDRLTGSSAANRLTGNGGNDTLDGHSGNDTLIGGSGNDNLSGGSGTDTAIFTGTVTVDLRLTGAQNTGEGIDRLVSIENLESGAGDDRLTGNTGSNRLTAHGGNDSLFGDAGNDTLLGGDGNDWLDGGSGNDRIEAGDGNDTLLGGIGRDTLLGGANADIFVFRTGAGADVISDFTPGLDRVAFDFTPADFALNYWNQSTILNGLSDTTSGAVLRLGGVQIVTFTNVDRSDLSWSDFQLFSDTVA